MGHPTSGSNGISNESVSGAGPSNGHSGNRESTTALRTLIKPILLEGTLMYPDDADWSEDRDTGDARTNGKGADTNGGIKKDKLETGKRKRMPIDREEVVRLMLQSMRDMGYSQAAEALELESGYILSTRSVADFEAAILGGRWEEALSLLPELGIPLPATSESSSSSSSIASGKTKANGNGTPADSARFLISTQKYLELLETNQPRKALVVLRKELAEVTSSPDLLHTLSGYMMCSDREDLYERAAWDGAAGTSRRSVLEDLQSGSHPASICLHLEFISPTIMVPSRRLATLLEQARRHQQQSCVYHDAPEASSLYIDHSCSTGQFPSETTHVLADHTDEVWRIEWSPDGMMLASAGKDKTVVIWQLVVSFGWAVVFKARADGWGQEGTRETSWQYSVIPLHHLRDHREAVDALAWSPDGKTLVTAADKHLYVWNTRTGEQRITPLGLSGPTSHQDTISAVHWMPDGSQFIAASMDCKMVFYSPLGQIVRSWDFRTLQIIDFAITSDQQRMIAATNSIKRVAVDNKMKPSLSARNADPPLEVRSDFRDEFSEFKYTNMEHCLSVIRLSDKEFIDTSKDLKCEVTGIKLSQDGQRVLVSGGPNQLQMWRLEPQFESQIQFVGHIQNHFLVRSCFGASRDIFVLSGSEDGSVYVWHNNSPEPIEILQGHSDVVNAVAWNPVASRKIFASCSDDFTVRIWQPPVPVDESLVMDVERSEGMLL
ncbi:WD repeat-containing protein 26, partial [Tremellales sp. Uapishka_1]